MAIYLTEPTLLSKRLRNTTTTRSPKLRWCQDIRVPFDLMAQDPRTEDPRNQDLKDFAKAPGDGTPFRIDGFDSISVFCGMKKHTNCRYLTVDMFG